jgi:hypothetical protein
VGPFTSVETVVGVAPHLAYKFRGKGDTLSPVELINAGTQFGAQVVELSLLLVEQAHRFPNHFARVGEVAALDLLSYASFDVGR